MCVGKQDTENNDVGVGGKYLFPFLFFRRKNARFGAIFIFLFSPNEKSARAHRKSKNLTDFSDFAHVKL